MKNIQVVDGAINSCFRIFEVEEEKFQILFPSTADIAFLEDFDHLDGTGFWGSIYSNEVDKKNIAGIHGTLHLTGSYVEKNNFPNRKESDV